MAHLISKYQKGKKTPQQAFNDAKKWVIKYRDSEGFKQRFLNMFKNNPDYKYYYPGLTLTKVKRSQIFPLFGLKYDPQVNDDNAEYDFRDFSVHIKDNSLPKIDIVKNWDEIMSHEVGHALDQSIDLEGSPNYLSYSFNINDFLDYSDLYPVLHHSKSGKKYREAFEKELFITNNNDIFNTGLQYSDIDLGPENYRILHDASPSENYADLIQLRKALYDNGIFNSFTTDIFTKEHLKKAKKKFGYLRLFKNYDDSQIIYMMNHIAQNNKDNNEINYA